MYIPPDSVFQHSKYLASVSFDRANRAFGLFCRDTEPDYVRSVWAAVETRDPVQARRFLLTLHRVHRRLLQGKGGGGGVEVGTDS